MKFWKNLYIITILILSVWYIFAYSNDLKDRLTAVWLDTSSIQGQKAISRYEMTRLLSTSQCFDCNYPKISYKDKYTDQRFTNFQKQNWIYLWDITFNNALFWGYNYYYCIAYGGDKWFANWYSTTQNSMCAGKFCGSNNASNIDAIRAAAQLLMNNVYEKYNVNWSDIQNYVNSLNKDSEEYKNFDTTDLGTIKDAAKSCTTKKCKLNSVEEMRVYMKYCRYNLESCEFTTFGSLKQWDFGITEFNLLFDENIVDAWYLGQLDLYANTDGEKILELVDGMVLKTPCKFDEDFDRDNIKNANDNCPYTYNPSQKDTDNDKVWDVCDDDVDGDGATNCANAVDDRWNIYLSKYKSSCNEDNCIFVVNENQKDSNNDGIGDACSSQDKYNWIYIKTSTLWGTVPAKIDFQAISDTNMDSYERDFGDGTSANGSQISKTFNKVGKFTVYVRWIYNNKSYIWQINITIWEDYTSYIWIAGKSSFLLGYYPLKAYISPDIKWDAYKTKWEIWDNSKIIQSTQWFNTAFASKWNYVVTWIVYDKTENILGYTQFSIWVNDKEKETTKYVWSSLEPSSLHISMGEEVNLDTNMAWFTEDDIQSIDRDFGDKSTFSNPAPNISKKYLTSGQKIIKENINLKDWTKLENIITINVLGDKSIQKWISISASPLVSQPGGTVSFTLDTKNISANEITKLTRDFGDGEVKKFDKDFLSHFNQNYSYFQSSTYPIKAAITLSDGNTFAAETTIWIKWESICLTNASSLKCDLDKNKIPNMCDEDIDGDGASNFLWLIKYDTSDCKIKDNINTSLLKQEYDLAAKWWNIDNCPFVANTDQADSDADGIGDACDTDTEENELDTDGDGIPDDQDSCQTIPENINWIEDEDGCPEIEYNLYSKSFIEVSWCNTCPCHRADYASALMTSDQVRAVLCSNTGKIYYRYSPAFTASDFLNFSNN